MTGSFGSSMALSIGNNIAFGDPSMSPEQILASVAIGGVTRGITNGTNTALNGRSFLTGATPTVNAVPVTIQLLGLKR